MNPEIEQEVEDYSKEQEIYLDWLKDNEDSLKKEYLSLFEDNFSEYCKMQFRDRK